MSYTEQLGRERKNSLQLSTKNMELPTQEINRKEILISEIKNNKELLQIVLSKTKGTQSTKNPALSTKEHTPLIKRLSRELRPNFEGNEGAGGRGGAEPVLERAVDANEGRLLAGRAVERRWSN